MKKLRSPCCNRRLVIKTVGSILIKILCTAMDFKAKIGHFFRKYSIFKSGIRW